MSNLIIVNKIVCEWDLNKTTFQALKYEELNKHQEHIKLDVDTSM